MRSIQSKKGMSIGDMYPAILSILMVGMILGVGLYILSIFHDSVSTDYTGAQTLINCSTATTLTDSTKAQVVISGLTATMFNTTASSTVTNFTYTSGGVVTWGVDLDNNCTTQGYRVNVTYDYNYDATDSAEESVTTSITGISTFADWIAIIVVVIAAAIVLGVVLTSFRREENI
jgi:hypothetical protein